MRSTTWEVLTSFYKDNFNMSEEIVDLIASKDILQMCVAGCSNESISSVLDVDIEEVKSVLSSVYNFDGWEKDLDINPYKVFTYLSDMGRTLFKDFRSEIDHINPSFSSIQIGTMFRACKYYDKITLKLDEKWV